MTVKKLVSVFLCALLMLCLAVPAFADYETPIIPVNPGGGDDNELPVAFTLEDSATGVEVSFSATVSVKPYMLSVKKITSGSVYDSAKALTGKGDIALYEIKLMSGGSAFQLKDKASVSVPFAAGKAAPAVFAVDTANSSAAQIDSVFNNGKVIFGAELPGLFAVTAGEDDTPETPAAKVEIVNYKEKTSVRSGESIVLRAKCENAAGAEIVWYVNGEKAGTGETYTAENVKGEFTVRAAAVSGDKVLAESGTETVGVNSGIFAIIIVFIKKLFGLSTVIYQ